MERVSLLSKVSELSASVHNEDDDLLLMDITLSSLGNYSFFFPLTLVVIFSMDVLHVKLDVQRINKLDFSFLFASLILLEQFGYLVFGVSKHHRSRQKLDLN